MVFVSTYLYKVNHAWTNTVQNVNQRVSIKAYIWPLMHSLTTQQAVKPFFWSYNVSIPDTLLASSTWWFGNTLCRTILFSWGLLRYKIPLWNPSPTQIWRNIFSSTEFHFHCIICLKCCTAYGRERVVLCALWRHCNGWPDKRSINI